MAHLGVEALRGGRAAATPHGKPGEDIEEVRKSQKKRKWDSDTIALALSRSYESRSHAKKEIARG